MSQNSTDDEHKPASADDGQADDLAGQVNEDIGGVQGTGPDEESPDATPSITPGTTPNEPAPDAGEIEWAGQVVKKPPTPEG
jgi:hypothetical protein